MKRLSLLIGLSLALPIYSLAQEGLKFGFNLGSTSTTCTVKNDMLNAQYFGSGYNFGLYSSYGLSESIALVFQPKFIRRNITTPDEIITMNFYNTQWGVKLRIPTALSFASHITIYGLPSINYLLKGYTYFPNLDRKVDLKGQVNTITSFLNFGIGLEREFDWGTFQLTCMYNKELGNFAGNNFKINGLSQYQDIEVKLHGISLNLGYLF